MDGADERRSVSPIPFSFGVQSSPPTTFTFEKKRPSLSPSNSDVPRQSIEHHDAVQANRDDTPSTTIFTPLGSPSPSVTRRASEVPSLNENLEHLRLASVVSEEEEQTCSTPLQRANDTSPAPFIQVTLSPSKSNSTETSPERADSVINGMANLRMRSSSSSSLSPGGGELRHSPSPPRRRRSGSGVPRPAHRVEDEEPPPSLFHSQTIQQSLVDTRAVVSRMADTLASSTMHQDESSSIRKFRQQALKLGQFQPPSSRTVGLVGDSGVGKSSLINSLLDKKSLARAVSYIATTLVMDLTTDRVTVGPHAHVSLQSITTTTAIRSA
jgi:ABC-type glutathione transport system ATPase component